MLKTLHALLAKGKIVYVLGCGLEYFERLLQEGSEFEEYAHLPKDQVFALSWNDFEKITIADLIKGYNSTSFTPFEFSTSPRAYTNLQYRFEYLKIAEGCDNKCTFCIIPKIRGKQRSVPMEKVLIEVQQMVAAGIQEIIIIAQDTTRYGTDLYGEPSLIPLLQQIDKLPGDFRFRLLYLYPDVVTLKQLDELKKLKKFLPYFDIPLQHISSPVLKLMGRFYDEGYIQQFLEHIAKIFPVRFVRTNLIIGFPGETEADFAKLKAFVQQGYFNNIALFEYHDEPVAASSKLPNKVDDHTIRTRFTQLRQLVNRQLLAYESERKGKEEIGYIMDIVSEKVEGRR
jgi:ribosomal protein S12 methylthiotransferase